jgi:hypothetical protein
MVKLGVVSAPLTEIDVVPEPPIASVLAERFVVDAPPLAVKRPLKVRAVDVAFEGNGYEKTSCGRR